MRTKALRRLPVLDRQKMVVGLLSVDDLCEAIPDALFTKTIKAIVGATHPGRRWT